MKSLCRRLARQVSLSGIDPCHPSPTPGTEEIQGWGDAAAAAPMATASWGSQLNLALDLNYGEDDNVTSNLLISEEEEEDDIFILPARAAQPMTPLFRWLMMGVAWQPPPSSSDMFDMCKGAAARLDIPVRNWLCRLCVLV